jgi:hypothetical protein
VDFSSRKSPRSMPRPDLLFVGFRSKSEDVGLSKAHLEAQKNWALRSFPGHLLNDSFSSVF